jgi:hypothetical protein
VVVYSFLANISKKNTFSTTLPHFQPLTMLFNLFWSHFQPPSSIDSHDLTC